MYKKSVRLRPLYLLVHTKCKNCDQVRLQSSLVININTPTLGREREQPESPRINITWQTSTNKKHSQCWITHSPGVKRSLTTEQTSRPGAVKYSRFVFLILKNPTDILPQQHMRLHPLYQEGQCQWSGCQAMCHNLWEFLHHLQNDHKVRRFW